MAKNTVEAALLKLKAQIADLQRAIDALNGVHEPNGEAPKVRKPRKKRGMPAEHDSI